VIPNGVEAPPPMPPGELIGTISVLEPVKGLDSFVRAAAAIRAQRPRARFAIFGEGSARGSLEELASSLGMAEALAFPGYVPVEEALSRLRLYVLTSWLENCPMALLEAMAVGRPAIATRVGGVPEIAADVVPLVPPGDHRSLARAALALLDDPQRAEAQGRASRDRVLDHFTAERNAEEMLRLYGRVARRRR
jgi:glycosyltransferase involved in cell wall biosynthesis